MRQNKELELSFRFHRNEKSSGVEAIGRREMVLLSLMRLGTMDQYRERRMRIEWVLWFARDEAPVQ